MSQAVKIFIISVCFIITAQFLSLSLFVLVPTALAEEPAKPTIGIDIREQVVVPLGAYNDLGSVDWLPCKDQTGVVKGEAPMMCWHIPWIAKYIGNMYRYGVVIGSMLAVMMIMIGGVLYLIGGLNPAMIARGKEYIGGAVTGLILLLGSYVLLQTINPNLVNMQPIEVAVMKEVVSLQGQFCTQAKAQDFEVEPANWESEVHCGDELKIKLSEAAQAGGTKTGGSGQTCMGDSCGNTDKACIKNFETGKYECVPVLVYGTVTYPDSMTTFMCGAKAQAAIGDGFYLDKFMLVAINQAWGGTTILPITAWIPGGKDQFQYSIKKDALNSWATANMNDSTQILLKVEINDASWPFFSTIDDEYLLSGKTNHFGKAVNEVVPALVCSSQGSKKAFSVQKQGTGNGLLYTPIDPLTWGQLKSSNVGVRWDINITKELWRCDSSSPADVLDKADCKSAVVVDPGLAKLGNACSTNLECEIDSKFPALVCTSGICTYGNWASPCKPGKNQCAKDYMCSNKQDQCVPSGSGTIGWLQRCEKAQGQCGAELWCQEPITWHGGANPGGCKDNDNEKIDTFLCAPSENNDVPNVCHCEKNADCPGNQPVCVDGSGNDNFCTTGQPGQPCDDNADCTTAGGKCFRNTCYNGATMDPGKVTIPY